MTVHYIYSQKNLIDFPQKYQMTPFEGKEFLSEFLSFRLKNSEQIKPKKIISLGNLIESLEKNNKKNTLSKIITESQLITFISHLINDTFSYNDKLLFEKFLKKFEIKKKLFDEYTNDFSSDFGTDKNYKNYILLSLCCITLYSKFDDLKFLNTCLKVNDTLCSVIESISDDVEKLLLFHSLDMEKNVILNLIKSKGLKF